MTAAATGATMETELAGSFDVAARTASGSGSYDSTAIGSGTVNTRGINFNKHVTGDNLFVGA